MEVAVPPDSLPATPELPRSPSVAPKDPFVCYVCRRRLASAEMLRKHEQLSSLHERNLKLMRANSSRRKSDLRQEIIQLRHGEDGSSKLTSSEQEYADLQEEIETRAKSVKEEKRKINISPTITLAFEGVSWTSNKQTNEDRMVVGFRLCAGAVVGCLVADGHCGDHCAQYLIENFTIVLEKHLQQEEGMSSLHVAKALRDSFREIDETYLGLAVENQIPAGSTLIVTVFFREESTDSPMVCITAHVGDSRAVMKREDVTRLTEDHKPDRPDEQERLSKSGGRVVDVGGIWRVFTPNMVSVGGRTLQWGLAVSRAFGDLALKKPIQIVTADAEISDPVPVRLGDLIVLGCDGIFDVLNDRETLEAAEAGGPLAVVKAAYGKLSDDNLTAVVVRIQEEAELISEAPNEAGVGAAPQPPEEASPEKNRARAKSLSPRALSPADPVVKQAPQSARTSSVKRPDVSHAGSRKRSKKE